MGNIRTTPYRSPIDAQHSVQWRLSTPGLCRTWYCAFPRSTPEWFQHQIVAEKWREINKVIKWYGQVVPQPSQGKRLCAHTLHPTHHYSRGICASSVGGLERPWDARNLQTINGAKPEWKPDTVIRWRSYCTSYSFDEAPGTSSLGIILEAVGHLMGKNTLYLLFCPCFVCYRLRHDIRIIGWYMSYTLNMLRRKVNFFICIIDRAPMRMCYAIKIA